MENNQNTYQQQVPLQMGQLGMMPPRPKPRRVVRNNGGWKQRFLSGNSGKVLTLRQERTIPNWLIGQSVIFFFIAMVACWVAWGYPMDAELAIIASVSILLFFYAGVALSRSWANSSEKRFIKNVFGIGVAIRILFALYVYFIFNPSHFGTTYGDGADVTWYMPYGEAIAQWVSNGFEGSFAQLMNDWKSAIDDVGYPIWLAIIYLLTGSMSDVLIPLMVKCFVGAYCAVCIYHVAKRHFGEGTARIAALFVALNPNMIYWCASMFKEAEMVFLCCLCVDLVDRTFTSGAKLTFKGLLPGLMVGFSLFFFRAALGVVVFLSMFAHIVMSSSRVMSAGKKIIAGFLVATTLLIGMGDRLRTQAESIVESVQNTEDNQQKNLEWRSNRKGGNTFAKYASTAVFAPLIFTIPFPTFNQALEEQIVQQQLSGGSFVKNIMSFFVLYVMMIMLISGEWRRHVFILAYTLGYLMCLVLSNFAQSSRFHMPIWPMLMLFAAYGVQLGKTNTKIRRWLPVVFVLEVMACLAWNWFKLKGRGMI